MIGLALAMIVIGIIFLFVITPVGIVVGLVGLALFVLWLLTLVRRTATSEPSRRPQ